MFEEKKDHICFRTEKHVVIFFKKEADLDGVKGKYGLNKKIDIYLSQRHTSNIVYFDQGSTKQGLIADGSVSNLKNVSLLINTADCLPIAILSNRLFAIVHAGWRGLNAGIIRNAVKCFTDRDVDVDSILVVLGPHIKWEDYEVGSDLYKTFAEYKDCFKKSQKTNKWLLSLENIAIKQFASLGIPKRSVFSVDVSTYQSKDFPSYRKNGKKAGFVSLVSRI